MTNLIVESYLNSTVNTILEDIAKKYSIDTTKEHLTGDIPVKEIKFIYITYTECVRMLYKNVGYLKEI
jgi:aspartyl/asparaginyl-tRNA synthetase